MIYNAYYNCIFWKAKKYNYYFIYIYMSICVITRFKNERHIMYEFIHHYLEEGINHFILIDDKSNDDYHKLNADWIKKKIISIHNSKGSR